jgi:tRNA(fMet)-specific endonuclease VapC
MATISRSDLFISEVTLAELLYGAVHSRSVERHLREVRELQRDIAVLPIFEALEDYADIRHALTSHGITVEDFDVLIGATARHFNLVVVTDNLKHFELMPGVRTENWIQRPE